ncbi:MAG: fibronectin type III domain-containing protein [Verrucomicrobiales bacterium]|nr:fibronectin type III domain-containing protein [Verrucomicrobiales bacterium]
MEIFLRSGRFASPSLIIALLFAVSEVCTFAAASVTLAWNPSLAKGVAGYNLYYGGRSGVYTNEISKASFKGTTVSGLVPGVTYYFAVTAYDRNGLESPFSSEISYEVPLNAASPLPTLNPISNFYLTVNSAAQTVSLTGISPGAANASSSAASKKPAGKIKITAASSNRKLLPAPKIRYSAGSSATMTFKPARNATGTATVTVTVSNGAKNNNRVTRTFTVTVLPAGQTMPATLKAAAQASGQFRLNITGVSGLKYIVQASTNLIDWIPVQTNTAPFDFTDPHTGEFSQRFYRSVSAP